MLAAGPLGKTLHKAGGCGRIIVAGHATAEWFATVGHDLKPQVFEN
jgi:hypothetical protein